MAPSIDNTHPAPTDLLEYFITAEDGQPVVGRQADYSVVVLARGTRLRTDDSLFHKTSEEAKRLPQARSAL